MWEKIISQSLLKNRLCVRIESEETFNINITSTLIDLYQQVKENWLKDYYNTKQVSSEGENKNNALDSFKRRSPFIPFALKNETGSILRFTTHITDMDISGSPVQYKPYEHWILVAPGETVPFSFKSRGK